eukprot:g8119.t1
MPRAGYPYAGRGKGKGKGKGKGRGKGKGTAGKVTSQKRAEMRDTLLSVLAHEKKKKKKQKVTHADDTSGSAEDALANISEAFGLMMIARPIDKPLGTVWVKAQIVGQDLDTNDQGETIQYECWDSGGSRGVEPDPKAFITSTLRDLENPIRIVCGAVDNNVLHRRSFDELRRRKKRQNSALRAEIGQLATSTDTLVDLKRGKCEELRATICRRGSSTAGRGLGLRAIMPATPNLLESVDGDADGTPISQNVALREALRAFEHRHAAANAAMDAEVEALQRWAAELPPSPAPAASSEAKVEINAGASTNSKYTNTMPAESDAAQLEQAATLRAALAILWAVGITAAALCNLALHKLLKRRASFELRWQCAVKWSPLEHAAGNVTGGDNAPGALAVAQQPRGAHAHTARRCAGAAMAVVVTIAVAGRVFGGHSIGAVQRLAHALHVASFVVLLAKIASTRSAFGVSLKTQQMLVVALGARYADLLPELLLAGASGGGGASGRVAAAAMAHTPYFAAMKMLLLALATLTALIVALVQHLNGNQDSFAIDSVSSWRVLVLPAFVLALLFHDRWAAVDVGWSFSIYLEALAALPQLVLAHRLHGRHGKRDSLMLLHLLFRGAYRALYLVNWAAGPRTFHAAAFAAAACQTAPFVVFFILSPAARLTDE